MQNAYILSLAEYLLNWKMCFPSVSFLSPESNQNWIPNLELLTGTQQSSYLHLYQK